MLVLLGELVLSATAAAQAMGGAGASSQAEGLSGLAQVTYERDKLKTTGSSTGKDSLVQDYQLQYQGHVYDRKLLAYVVGVEYTRENDWISTTGSGNTSGQTTGLDWDFDLNFLQSSKYPFNIYKTRLVQPSWTVEPQLAISSTLTEDTWGLGGSAYLGRGLTLNYGANRDTVETVGQGGMSQQGDNVSGGLTYKSFTLNYNYGDISSAASGMSTVTHDATFSTGTIKTGSATSGYLTSEYRSDTHAQNKELISNANFSYVPSRKFSDFTSLYENHIAEAGKSGDFITLTNNSNYILNKYFTEGNGVQLFKSMGSFGSSTVESLTPGISFAKPVGKYSFSANTSVSGLAEQGAAAGGGMESFAYSLGGGVSRALPSLNGSASAAGSYYDYFSTHGGKATRYYLNGVFMSRFTSNLTFQSDLNFDDEDTTGDNTGGSATVSRLHTERLISDSSLTYLTRVGFRGFLSGTAGVTAEAGTNPSIYKFVEADFKYALGPVIMVETGGDYSTDSYSNSTTLDGFAETRCEFGSVILMARGEWDNTQWSGAQTTTSTRMIFQASRAF